MPHKCGNTQCANTETSAPTRVRRARSAGLLRDSPRGVQIDFANDGTRWNPIGLDTPWPRRYTPLTEAEESVRAEMEPRLP